MSRFPFLLVFLFFSFASISQSNTELAIQQLSTFGEVTIQLNEESFKKVSHFKAWYSLDHASTKSQIQLVLNRSEFDFIRPYLDSFAVLQRNQSNERMIGIEAWNRSDCISGMDAYPTYELYEQMMKDFANEYPDICRLSSLGTLSSGRKLWMIKISKNPDTEESEPKFLYTSTMHGNELAGFPTMLRLIDYLLCNYGSDNVVDYLIDNMEIYINPLANPDGTYRGGNDNVSMSTRSNANFVDLNRNFPDPQDGPHPDGREYQEETLAFMNLAENIDFDMSCNIHGGVEVVNYPFDTYVERHADDDWWQYVCREYADLAQFNSTSGYMNDLQNGITNGFDWYEVQGGRQDYMTHTHYGREMTLEISTVKKLPADQLDFIWEANKASLLRFMEQSLLGPSGIVTDSITGDPLEAEVFIEGHDILNSQVFSKLPTGRYHRPIKAGNYDFTFTADGYIPKTISVNPTDGESFIMDVQLASEVSSLDAFTAQNEIYSYGKNLVILSSQNASEKLFINVFDVVGIKVHFSVIEKDSHNHEIHLGNLNDGLYHVVLTNGTYSKGEKIILMN